MVWSRRSLLMAVLLGLPIVFALIYRFALVAHSRPKLTGFDLYGVIVAVYYVRNVLPLAALFYRDVAHRRRGGGQDPHLPPDPALQRASILAGKFAAYVVTTLVMTLPATVITFFLLVHRAGLRGNWGPRCPTSSGTWASWRSPSCPMARSSRCSGVLLRRPVIPGLLFLFVWELVANLPGYLPRFTLTA